MKNNLYYFTKGLMATVNQAKNLSLKPTKANRINVDSVLRVHYIPDINKLGVRFAGVTYNPFTKRGYIVVDDHFLSMDKHIQKAILCHECGHYEHGHIQGQYRPKALYERFVFSGKMSCASFEEKNLLLEATLKNRNINDELIADAYAVKHTSKEDMLATLTAMSKVVMSPELELRYKAIAGEAPPWSCMDALNAFFSGTDNCISVDSLPDYDDDLE